MAQKKTTPKAISFTMDTPQQKKHVVRFDGADDDAAMQSAYISKAALKELGDPDEVRITIEAV